MSDPKWRMWLAMMLSLRPMYSYFLCSSKTEQMSGVVQKLVSWWSVQSSSFLGEFWFSARKLDVWVEFKCFSASLDSRRENSMIEPTMSLFWLSAFRGNSLDNFLPTFACLQWVTQNRKWQLLWWFPFKPFYWETCVLVVIFQVTTVSSHT